MLNLGAENATKCPKPFHWICHFCRKLSMDRVTDNGDDDDDDDDDTDLE